MGFKSESRYWLVHEYACMDTIPYMHQIPNYYYIHVDVPEL